jgi:hypothetical protein
MARKQQKTNGAGLEGVSGQMATAGSFCLLFQ